MDDPTRTREQVIFQLERAENALERAKAYEKRAVDAVHQLEGGFRGLFARITGGYQAKVETALVRAEAAIEERKDAVQKWKALSAELETMVKEEGPAPVISSRAPIALNQAAKTLKRAVDTRQALLGGQRADWGALRLSVADLRAVNPHAGVPDLPTPDAPDVAAALADWIAEVEVIVGMLQADSEDAAAERALGSTTSQQQQLAAYAIRETQTLLHALQAGRFRDTSPTVRFINKRTRYGPSAQDVAKAQKMEELSRMQATAELAASNLFATLENPPQRASMQTISWTNSLNDVALNDCRVATDKTLRILQELFPDL